MASIPREPEEHVCEWRYCPGCKRPTPQEKRTGDCLWTCPWCHKQNYNGALVSKGDQNGK